jgi:hypothetical protein
VASGIMMNGTRTLPSHGSPIVPRSALFSIGFALSQSRDLLRRMLKEHVTDDARQMLAKQVVEHLELSGFVIDEERQVMTKRPPTHGHG